MRGPARFGTAALISLSFAVLALVVLHVVRSDLAPSKNMISNYAVGPHGWIMTACFLFFSAACLTLLLALAGSGHASRAAHLGAFLLGIAALGLIVTAVFPTDLPGAPFTRSGDIHEISFLVNVGSLVSAALLISIGLLRPARWHAFGRTSAALAVLIVLTLILQFLTLHRGQPYGLVNRLFALLIFAWMALTAVRVRRAARAPRGTDPPL